MGWVPFVILRKVRHSQRVKRNEDRKQSFQIHDNRTIVSVVATANITLAYCPCALSVTFLLPLQWFSPSSSSTLNESHGWLLLSLLLLLLFLFVNPILRGKDINSTHKEIRSDENDHRNRFWPLWSLVIFFFF